MSKAIITLTAFLVSLLGFSQVSENRNVADYTKLKASQGIEVFYTVSNTKSIKVETDDNEKLKFIKTEVDDATLKIFVDTGSGNYKGSKKGKRKIDGVSFNVLKVTVSGPALESIKSSSSANIKIQNLNSSNKLVLDVSSSGSISGKFNCENLSLDASSSGDMNIDVDAKTTNAETSSSADVKIKGKTGKLVVKSSSSSSFEGYKFEAEEAVATASSSADVNLNVTKTLSAKASSSADINYTGNPSNVVKDQSSSGSVNSK